MCRILRADRRSVIAGAGGDDESAGRKGLSYIAEICLIIPDDAPSASSINASRDGPRARGTGAARGVGSQGDTCPRGPLRRHGRSRRSFGRMSRADRAARRQAGEGKGMKSCSFREVTASFALSGMSVRRSGRGGPLARSHRANNATCVNHGGAVSPASASAGGSFLPARRWRPVALRGRRFGPG